MKHDNKENVRDKNCDCRTINRMQIKASGNIKEIKTQYNFSTITRAGGQPFMLILTDTEQAVTVICLQHTGYRLDTLQTRESRSKSEGEIHV